LIPGWIDIPSFGRMKVTVMFETIEIPRGMPLLASIPDGRSTEIFGVLRELIVSIILL